MRAGGEVRPPATAEWSTCSSSSLPVKAPRRPASSRPGWRTRRSRPRFAWLSAVAGLDLVHYGTEADADTIRDTAIAQPLLVATGLLAALELFPHPADAFGQIGAVAGHSVGELTAAAGARRRSPPSRRWCWCASAATRWPRPPRSPRPA